jgi:hypothetical protein
MMTAMTFVTEKIYTIMYTVMDDSTKHKHDDLFTMVSSFEQQGIKTPDNKPTTTKKTRPSNSHKWTKCNT